MTVCVSVHVHVYICECLYVCLCLQRNTKGRKSLCFLVDISRVCLRFKKRKENKEVTVKMTCYGENHSIGFA